MRVIVIQRANNLLLVVLSTRVYVLFKPHHLVTRIVGIVSGVLIAANLALIIAVHVVCTVVSSRFLRLIPFNL